MTSDTRDRFSIILAGSPSDPIRTFELRWSWVRMAVRIAAGAALLLLCLAGATTLWVLHAAAGGEAAERALALEDELERLRARTLALEGVVDSLAREGNRLRLVAGLDPVNEEVLMAGIGGGRVPRIPDDPALQRAALVRSNLASLERRTELLASMMEEADAGIRENVEILSSTPSLLPADGWVSSAYGSRLHPVRGLTQRHHGIDVAAPRGSPIVAAADGRVTRAGRNGGYGLMVEIDHGRGYRTLYAHASEILVKRGQRVERGQTIARVGATGLATAPHVHYEVWKDDRPENPRNYLLFER